jgi:Outer membrane protein beta-barrel domain
MRNSILALLASSFAVVPLAAQAEGLSYSQLDAGYVVTDIDNFDDEADGFMLRGSYEFVENWFGYARYLDQSVDAFGFDVDLTQFSLGLGYALPLADTTDLYGKLGYTSVEADAGGASADDDGYELAIGLRSQPMEQLELEGSVNYIDLSDSGDDTSLGLAARWYLTQQLAVGLEGEFADDTTSYGIGVRWSFGQ